MSARRGIFVAPFEELADAAVVTRLAVRAEEAGFDGFFLWDHVDYRAPVRALADPWICMAALACATERVLTGPLITPPARRRIHKLARETVTLDRLSGGRLVFGAGLGSDNSGEFSKFGEESDARARAALLDDGLDQLVAYWDGEFEPRPLQQPRIPIWLAARWPNRKPVRRALRWDGLFPIDLPGPEALAELTAEVREARAGDDRPFEIVVTNPVGTDPAPWEAAGATWCLTGFGPQPTVAEVEAAIDDAQGT
jgi:alkanesulfonate monooxygenase SsuD/methylene tetrahydromethanopterin reductase-like flavin-dependent oxidoreductase (luciferase family)